MRHDPAGAAIVIMLRSLKMVTPKACFQHDAWPRPFMTSWNKVRLHSTRSR